MKNIKALCLLSRIVTAEQYLAHARAKIGNDYQNELNHCFGNENVRARRSLREKCDHDTPIIIVFLLYFSLLAKMKKKKSNVHISYRVGPASYV